MNVDSCISPSPSGGASCQWNQEYDVEWKSFHPSACSSSDSLFPMSPYFFSVPLKTWCAQRSEDYGLYLPLHLLHHSACASETGKSSVKTLMKEVLQIYSCDLIGKLFECLTIWATSCKPEEQKQWNNTGLLSLILRCGFVHTLPCNKHFSHVGSTWVRFSSQIMLDKYVMHSSCLFLFYSSNPSGWA